MVDCPGRVCSRMHLPRAIRYHFNNNGGRRMDLKTSHAFCNRPEIGPRINNQICHWWQAYAFVALAGRSPEELRAVRHNCLALCYLHGSHFSFSKIPCVQGPMGCFDCIAGCACSDLILYSIHWICINILLAWRGKSCMYGARWPSWSWFPSCVMCLARVRQHHNT